MKTFVTGARGSVQARISGFSVVELMTVIAILAIVAAFAVPGFQAVINNNRLASASNELTATLQAARIEAIRRGVRSVVCPSDDGETCTTGARWRGFLAFEDDNGNGDFDAGERVQRSFVLSPPTEMWASGNVSGDSRIVFRHDGFAYDKDRQNLMAGNLRACIPTQYPNENSRDVSLAAGGRVAVQRIDSDGACGAPGNP